MAAHNTIMTPRQMVTALIDAIPTAEPISTASNPLGDLTPEGRNALLTLYALFEREVLPALDLLDRKLITRLTCTQLEGNNSSDDTAHEQVPSAESKPCSSKFYLVRSAQQQTNRNTNYEHINYYEVRLDAWSCSCPAFTFAAFPATGGSLSETGQPVSTKVSQTDPVPQQTQGQWLFGGLTRGSDMPVCKHLLACILIEHCALFAGFVEERQVSIEEIAGWAAGWGD